MKNIINKKKNIAIIGSGISGLTCAHYLIHNHDVTLFEAHDYIGGHVNTIDVRIAESDKNGKLSQLLTKKSKLNKNNISNIEKASIDTGFIVFNERTYPNFLRLLTELNVSFQKTDMSFSVKNSALNFEYNGHTLNTILAQRKNILSPTFWRFVNDIITFNHSVKELHKNYQKTQKELQRLEKLSTLATRGFHKKRKNDLTNKLKILSQQTLGDYLEQNSFGDLFADNYLLPMVSAIWSMGLVESKSFPLIFFAKFFHHHGLLDVINRPQWFTILGGSKQYVNKLVENFVHNGGNVYVNAPVQSVKRDSNKEKNSVSISYLDKSNGDDKGSLLTAHFDEVIFACNADTSYKLLSDINEDEKSVLSQFMFSDNRATLHTDTSALPKKTLAWASWNYLLPHQNKKQKQSPNQAQVKQEAHPKPILTYHMNILQRLVKKHNYLVTLNHKIKPEHIIKEIDYRHPVFDVHMIHAQQEWKKISGINNTHFCGAYWFNGFHEDGVRSGLRVCKNFDKNIEILDTVNKNHLRNGNAQNNFSYDTLPLKADQDTKKVRRRHLLSATTNTF